MMMQILAAESPLEHVVDANQISTSSGITLISNHIMMMIVAAILLLLFVPRWVRVPNAGDDVGRMTPRGSRNAFEAICMFLREFVGRPNLGDYTDVFIPYLWTVFFFILTCNLLGLLPLAPLTKPLANAIGLHHGIGGTATGNIWTTATLAVCTLFMIAFNGLRLHGMNYVKHFFMGPFPINVVIAFLEVIGLFAKSFALAVRLFANMLAGHILLAVLLSFIFMAGAASATMGFAIAVPVVFGSVAIMCLELFVAFLQAFIFTFLTAVFIGMAVNIHHDDEHHEAHAPSHEHEGPMPHHEHGH